MLPHHYAERRLEQDHWLQIGGPSNYQGLAEKAFGPDAQRMLRGIGKLYNLKTVRREGEHPMITATGETRIWEFQSQPLPKLLDGRRVVLSLAVDVTERR